ncbi:MAG TPA: DUF4192 domain-containing protein [Mycobacteriales bacterium]|nr:DUF4192 domain-containing protein [Mycobacteriales bacterium]
MTSDALPALRLSDPADWLHAMPYLFGFAPRESLVLLGLSGPGKRVTFQLRVDLPVDEADADHLADHLGDVLGRQAGIDHVLVVLYGDEPGPPTDLDHAVWEALDDRLGELPAVVDVVDAMVVRGDRWWSLDCADPRCCPPDGTPWSPEDSSRVAAELVLRGCVARGSRDEVAAEIAPIGGLAQVLVAQRCTELDDADWTNDSDLLRWSLPWVDAAVERWRSVLTSPGDLPRLDADALAALLYPLDHKTLRDRVAGVCLRHADRAKPLLREVLRRAPEEYAAPPATILGLLEWADGDGLRAGIAFERALQADPAYAFAGVLYQGLQHGIRFPEEFRDSLKDMARKRWRNPSRRRRT